MEQNQIVWSSVFLFVSISVCGSSSAVRVRAQVPSRSVKPILDDESSILYPQGKK